MSFTNNAQSMLLAKETLELHQRQQLAQPQQNQTRLYNSQFNQTNDSNSQSHLSAIIKQNRPKRSRNEKSPNPPSIPSVEKRISKGDSSESQDHSDTEKPIDPVIQPAGRTSRQTTARKRTRFDKAPLVVDESKSELNATIAPPVFVKRTVDLNLQSIHVKNSVENTLKKLYQIKMNEIDSETRMLQQGELPEYHKQLAIIERNIVEKLSTLKCLHSNEVLSHKSLCNETSKCANDTLNSMSRVAKQNLMDHKTTLKWKLVQEMYNIKKHPNPNNDFMVSSTTLKRRKEAQIQIADKVELEDWSEQVGQLPKWTQTLLKRHAQSGDKSLIVPPYCTELEEYEKDEDIAFIRMCRS